ncbi:O-antigen polymerase [Elizabethkingia anophelis]|uniref:O-antigen polymerase n=1 Tax=Elizabethkingia anophelis TaxID=1117645 RepID=UPI00389208C4
MIFVIIILLLIFTFFGFLTSKSWVAPEVISPLCWSVILVFYTFVDHGMFSLSNTVLYVIFAWNLFLLLGIYCSKLILNFNKRPFNGDNNFNSSIRNLYYKISVYGFLPTLYVIYLQISSIPGDFFFKLRMANTGLIESKVNLGIFAYTTTFAFVSYFIELLSINKSSKKRLYVILFINIVLALSTMSKSSFLFLIFSTLITLIFKYRSQLPKVKILKYAILAFIVMFSVQRLRDGNESKGNDLNLFYAYLFGGVPALDQIVNSNMKSMDFGQNTLAFFNNIQQKLENTDKKEKRYYNDFTNSGYVYTPIMTNVYTVIGPIWLDFKYFGIVIFAFIVGYISNIFYVLSVKKYQWAMIVYSYLACVLILQFFGEYIFTNMSYFLQLVILSYLPFKFRNKIFTWKR